MIELAGNLSKEEANGYLAILESAGIDCMATRQSNRWFVWVEETDYGRAWFEIESYHRENPKTDNDRTTDPDIRLITGCGVWIVLILLACYAAIDHYGGISHFAPIFGASAEAILKGERYRTVTALMLHGDLVHLIANLASGALFFSLVCGLRGPGVGMLSCLVSGILGNYFTAMFYEKNHISIGASTAIFGAVGILAGLRSIRPAGNPERRFGSWIPIGSGICLLAWLSGGERTDLMAHLFGFISGLGIGFFHRLTSAKPAGPGVQQVFLTVAVAVVLLSGFRMW